MTVQLGQTAPDFEQDTNHGRLRFHNWLGGSWAVLFSHPQDFTAVCNTELGEAARLQPEFDRRGVKIISLSVGAPNGHGDWKTDIARAQGSTVTFPMIADADRSVSTLYGMIHPHAEPNVPVRTVFIIDPAKTVRLMLIYPYSTGRNFHEILRVIDSLQFTDAHKVATPVNWQPGERAIIPTTLSDEDARARFPQGWDAPTPYLRYVDLSDQQT